MEEASNNRAASTEAQLEICAMQGVRCILSILIRHVHANDNHSMVIVATKQPKDAEAAAQSLSHVKKLCDYDTRGSNIDDATAIRRCKASIWAVLSPLHHTRAACKMNTLRNALLTPALQVALQQDRAHSCTIRLSTEVIATQSEDMHLAGCRRAPRALQKLLHSSAAHGHVCDPSPHTRAYAPCEADVDETSTNHIHPAATPPETLIQRARQATHDFAYEGAHECYLTDGSAKDIENQDGVPFATGAACVRCIADRADQSFGCVGYHRGARINLSRTRCKLNLSSHSIPLASKMSASMSSSECCRGCRSALEAAEPHQRPDRRSRLH